MMECQAEKDDESSSSNEGSECSGLSPPTSPRQPVDSSPKTSPGQLSATSAISFSDESPPPSSRKRKKRSEDEVFRSTLRRIKLQLFKDALEVATESDDIPPTFCSESQNLSTMAPTAEQFEEHELLLSSPEVQENIQSISESECSSEDSVNCLREVSDSECGVSCCSSTYENQSVSSSSGDELSDSISVSSDNNSDDSVELLYDGSDMTSDEALLGIMRTYVKQKWSKTSLDETVRLVKRMLPQPNDLPRNGKAALTRVNKLTASYKVDELTYCKDCRQLTDSVNECIQCEKVDIDKGKFYMYSIEDQIRHMFEHRGLASVIDQYRDNRERKAGFICDVLDGTEYKKIKIYFNGLYDLILQWNTDGVSLSDSSKQELYPILATICEVPPRLRSAFVIVCGVFVSNIKPDMNVFLKSFVEAFRKINDNGGVSWVDPVSGESFSSLITAPIMSADAPVKAMVLNHKYHNSRYGCNTCEQKAKKIELTAEEVAANAAEINPRKRVRRKRRFLFQDDTAGAAPLRRADRMNMQGDLAERRKKSRKGVLGRAVVTQIPYFDRASSVCLEYMHLILLGVVKLFLTQIFFEKKGPWYIGDKGKEINYDIRNIKVPDFIKRLPRGLSDFHFWKASEFRNFLLYYSLPIFKNRLPKAYFQHWILLVSAVLIILKDAVSEVELTAAEVMLRIFVRDVGTLYEKKCYTYNVHNLLHVCLLVRRWGPAWATSAFIFESLNGYISSLIHGTKNLGKEFLGNVKTCQSVAVLESTVNSKYCKESGGLPEVPLTNVFGKPLMICMLDSDQKNTLLNAGLGTFVLYKRAKINSEIYTCKLYDANKRRSNSLVKFHSPNSLQSKYGEIITIVKAEDQTFHVLLQIFKINQVNLFFHEESRYCINNLLPFEETNNLVILPATCLITKVLKIDNYLAIRPNSYEINL